jgi:hypothetical protein
LKFKNPPKDAAAKPPPTAKLSFKSKAAPKGATVAAHAPPKAKPALSEIKRFPNGVVSTFDCARCAKHVAADESMVLSWSGGYAEICKPCAGTNPGWDPRSDSPKPADAAAPQQAAVKNAKSTSKPGSFVVRWRSAVLTDHNLGISTKTCLMVLAEFMNAAGYCWPSQQTVAEVGNLSARTVWSSIQEAVAKKWLSKTPRKDVYQQGTGRPPLAYQAMIPEDSK